MGKTYCCHPSLLPRNNIKLKKNLFEKEKKIMNKNLKLKKDRSKAARSTQGFL
jgi:hypothetical protein